MTRNDALLSCALVGAFALLIWFGLDGDGMQLHDVTELPAALRSLIP